MTIQFRCRCGTLLLAEAATAGQHVLCPTCFGPAQVPPAADSAQPPKAIDPPPGADGNAPTIVVDEVTGISSTDTFDLPIPLQSLASHHGLRRLHFKRLYVMAGMLILAALVQLIPAWHYGDWTAPVWMRAIVLLSASQIALAMWMLLVPDWSTLWVATLVAACVAALQAFALALAVATPTGDFDLLEMNDLRDLAQLWLTAMLLLSASISFACGQFSFQWRNETLTSGAAQSLVA
jgi:hypothetical protein